jgi:hypothetical protein
MESRGDCRSILKSSFQGSLGFVITAAQIEHLPESRRCINRERVEHVVVAAFHAVQAAATRASTGCSGLGP